MKVSHGCHTELTTSALPWHLQPFKTHPKISAVIWGPGMILTKSGLLCRIHLVVNDYNVDNNDGSEIDENTKEVAILSLSVENAPIFAELMRLLFLSWFHLLLLLLGNC